MDNRVDLNLLIYLDALLDELGISRAAKRLRISQPALSNALARLRNLFDDELLIRSGTKMFPTALAERVRLPLKQALTMLDKEVLVKQSFDPKTDHFQFNVSFYGYEEAIILPILWQRISEYPLLSITNRTPNKIQMAKALRFLDVHFTSMTIDENNADLTTCRWLSDYFVCVAHQGFAASSLSAQSYFQQSHLLVCPQGDESIVDKILMDQGQSRITKIKVSEFGSVPVMLARDRKLVSTIPSKLAKTWLQNFPLQIVPFPLTIPPLKIFLTWHKSAEDLHALTWFKQQLFEASTSATMLDPAS